MEFGSRFGVSSISWQVCSFLDSGCVSGMCIVETSGCEYSVLLSTIPGHGGRLFGLRLLVVCHPASGEKSIDVRTNNPGHSPIFRLVLFSYSVPCTQHASSQELCDC